MVLGKKSALLLSVTLLLGGCAPQTDAQDQGGQAEPSPSKEASPGGDAEVESPQGSGKSESQTEDPEEPSPEKGESQEPSPDSSESGDPKKEESENEDCEPPDPQQDWILAYQREIVAKLSGQEPLEDGSTLGVRSSRSEREATVAFLKAFWSQEFDVHAHNYRDGATNLYVVIEATHTTRGKEAPALVFGAHFDSVPKSPGANDNATGVAAVMSAARFVASMPCRSRTWHFVLFDEEEIGLVGSAAYAKKLKQDKTVIQEVHTIDQMGWDKDKDRAIELEQPGAGLLECYQEAQDKTNQSFPLTKTRTGATDHVSFRKAGFLAVGITEEYVSGDTTPHYHRPGDTFDTVDFEYLESTTILIHQMLIDRSEVPEGG